MAIIKSYTDIPQSKKLAEILPLDSADMFYVAGKGEPIFIGNKMVAYGDDDYDALGGPDVLCWSLAALSEFILPYIADNDGNNYKFYLSKDGLDRWVAYYKSDNVSIHICEESDNMIDVILEMVCWLKNEEYI